MNANDKLMNVFSQCFDLPADADYEGLKYHSIPRWDSVGHMQLVAALEQEFDVMLETEDVIGMSSFPKARETLERYEVSFAG